MNFNLVHTPSPLTDAAVALREWLDSPISRAALFLIFLALVIMTIIGTNRNKWKDKATGAEKLAERNRLDKVEAIESREKALDLLRPSRGSTPALGDRVRYIFDGHVSSISFDDETRTLVTVKNDQLELPPLPIEDVDVVDPEGSSRGDAA